MVVMVVEHCPPPPAAVSLAFELKFWRPSVGASKHGYTATLDMYQNHVESYVRIPLSDGRPGDLFRVLLLTENIRRRGETQAPSHCFDDTTC
jgi:hypothetical protein